MLNSSHQCMGRHAELLSLFCLYFFWQQLKMREGTFNRYCFYLGLQARVLHVFTQPNTPGVNQGPRNKRSAEFVVAKHYTINNTEK